MRARGAVGNFSNNSRCLTETQLPEPTALFISDESEEFRVARNSFLWILTEFSLFTQIENMKKPCSGDEKKTFCQNVSQQLIENVDEG
jgi:hypothetical protein